jgi:hypothetical protein
MKKNKQKLIYKIITIFTLAVPLPLYLFLSATLFSISPDYTIKHADSEDLTITDTYIYTDKENAVIQGVFAYEDGRTVFYYDEETIIQTDDGYWGVEDGELKDIKALELQRSTGYKLPMAFLINAVGVFIVLMVVQGKMQWYKKYPRISTLLALVTGTLVLLVIDTIVSNLFMVFLIATISWAIYCLEYFVNENFITDDEADKVESDLMRSLKDALGGDK